MRTVIIAGCIGAIIGMIIGRFFREPEYYNDCPQIELGYRCRGDLCDHHESELYRAKAVMAQEREKGYWRGGPNA